MRSNLNILKDNLLWGQLICFLVAVSFVAGGGQARGLETGYNDFIYLKAVFLIVPIVVSCGWIAVSFFDFFHPFLVVLKKHIGLLIYFFFAFISLVFAYDVTFSLGRLIYTAVAVFSLWCLITQYRMLSADKRVDAFYHHLLWALFILLLGIPLLAFLNAPSMAVTNMRGAIQTTGLIHPNTVASLSVYALCHALFFSVKHSRGGILIRGLLIVLSLTLIAVIFSRSVIVAMGAAFIVVGVFNFLWFRSYLSLISLGGGAFIALVFFLLFYFGALPLEWLISVISRTEDGSDLITLTHRTDLWQRLLENLDVKVLFLGHGYGVMTPGFGVNFGTGILYGAHNIYLSILLGTGIFSLIAFLGYLGSIFLKLCRFHQNLGKKITLHSLAILSFFMIHSLTSTEFSLNLSISFTLLMITTALAVQGRQA